MGVLCVLALEVKLLPVDFLRNVSHEWHVRAGIVCQDGVAECVKRLFLELVAAFVDRHAVHAMVGIVRKRLLDGDSRDLVAEDVPQFVDGIGTFLAIFGVLGEVNEVHDFVCG